MLAGELAGHLCIAVDTGMTCKTGCLDGSGSHYSLADDGTALTLLHVVQLADGDRRHLNVQVSTQSDFVYQ